MIFVNVKDYYSAIKIITKFNLMKYAYDLFRT